MQVYVIHFPYEHDLTVFSSRRSAVDWAVDQTKGGVVPVEGADNQDADDAVPFQEAARMFVDGELDELHAFDADQCICFLIETKEVLE